MRRNKWLLQLLITAYFILNTAVLSAFAAHTDGHMDVTARIEAAFDETETADSEDIRPDRETDREAGSQTVRTGDSSRPELWIALLFISGCGGCTAVLYGKRNSILK